MLLPEKKIQWHPTLPNRFVVGGGSSIGQIKVYDYDGKTEKITEVTTVGDLAHMRCFVISPNPYTPSLLAIGSTLGKVDLMRYSAHQPSNTIRTPSIVTLPVRSTRACNCVAFSPIDPNYLAVGLDKVRGDPSLVLWDIEYASASLSKSSAQTPSNPQGTFTRPSSPLPLHSSSHPSTRPDKAILQTWSHNEVVTSLSFFPHSKPHLVAGISHRWLRLFDFRYPYSQANPLSTNTKSVHGITVDPFDSYRFACFGDDGAVRVWDIRRFSAPVLTFSERDASADGGGGGKGQANSLASVEFARNRRGIIATMEKDATVVRFWDTVRATVTVQQEDRSGNLGESVDVEEGTGSKISKFTRLPWTSSGEGAMGAGMTEKEKKTQSVRVEELVLCNTRISLRFSRPLSTFAFIPPPSSPSTSHNSYSIAVVTKDGDLDVQTLYDAPHPHWSGRGELSIGSGRKYVFYSPYREGAGVVEPWDVIPMAIGGPEDGEKRGSLQGRQRKEDTRNGPSVLGISNVRKVPSGTDMTPRPGHIPLRNEHDLQQSLRGRLLDPQVQVHLPMGTVSRNVSGGMGAGTPRSGSKGRIGSDERTSRRTIGDDISMVMRRRVVKGYGIENLQHNASITRTDPHSETLSEIWLWIENSRHILSSPSRIHGFEFSNQGVLGVWDGFPASTRPSSMEREPLESARQDLANLFIFQQDDDRDRDVTLSDGYRTPRRTRGGRRMRRNESPADGALGDFAAAVHALNLRKSGGAGGSGYGGVARVAAHTGKIAQRRFCLTLCGWNYGDEELMRAATRWEKEGRLTKATCWLLFTDHQDKAIECLMRSDDERLRIMSGTLSALLAQRSTSNQLRDHYSRLIVRIEDPYLRVMLTHVALDDWSEVLQEESLPLRERLAIAFRFLEDRPLSSYLHHLTDQYRNTGDIEGLILTGLTSQGFDILQAYVDSTGDVQTASILAAFVSPALFRDTRAERWLEAYHDLLDGWKLFHFRCQFDIARGRIIKETVTKEDVQPFDWVKPQLAVRCGFCKKMVSAKTPLVGAGTRIRVNCCQTCGRSLPRCSICLEILGLGFDAARDAELIRESDLKDTIDEALVFCQTCKHGGHLSHILEWFYGRRGDGHYGKGRAHEQCPVAGCDCRCSME